MKKACHQKYEICKECCHSVLNIKAENHTSYLVCEKFDLIIKPDKLTNNKKDPMGIGYDTGVSIIEGLKDKYNFEVKYCQDNFYTDDIKNACYVLGVEIKKLNYIYQKTFIGFSKCCPGDKFNLNYGIDLARKRAFKKLIKWVKEKMSQVIQMGSITTGVMDFTGIITTTIKKGDVSLTK